MVRVKEKEASCLYEDVKKKAQCQQKAIELNKFFIISYVEPSYILIVDHVKVGKIKVIICRR